MGLVDGLPVFSRSDLTGFLACDHLLTLAVQAPCAVPCAAQDAGADAAGEHVVPVCRDGERELDADASSD